MHRHWVCVCKHTQHMQMHIPSQHDTATWHWYTTLQHDTATRYFSESWSACAPSIWHTHKVRNCLTKRMHTWIHSMCIESLQSRGWRKSWCCAACAASYMTHTQSPVRHKTKKERCTRVFYSYKPEVWIESFWLRSWLENWCQSCLYSCNICLWVAMCCSMLQCVAVCCSALRCAAVCQTRAFIALVSIRSLQWVAVCISSVSCCSYFFTLDTQMRVIYVHQGAL